MVDADQIARQVVAPGSQALAEIVACFGASVLGPDGTLDRRRLGAIVFQNEQARRQLEAITHPRIQQQCAEQVSQLAQHGYRLVAYEAALLVENNLTEQYRPLVVVTVDEPTQTARIMQRDGLTREQAQARIRAQMPLAPKVAVADHVIDTAAPLEVVRARADAVLEAVARTLGIDPGLGSN